VKIGLIGYGKMGRAVESVALERGHQILAKMCSSNADFSELKNVDVCIDFTKPSAVWENVQKIAPLKKTILIGTSGWEAHLSQIKALALNTPFGLFYASNFSVGIYLFKKLFAFAKQLTSPLGFDIAGVEMHHNQKRDLPSGTAQHFLDVPFASVRCGDLIGMHQVIFNSAHDTIELIHRASNRKGFARGAIAAAEWMQGRMGIWTFDDFIEDTKCNLKELLHL